MIEQAKPIHLKPELLPSARYSYLLLNGVCTPADELD